MGTVREDYSAEGTAWDFTPHDVAKSKAYRWGEEGIGGSVMTSSFYVFHWLCGIKKIRS